MNVKSRLKLRTYPQDDARHWRERIFLRQHSPSDTMRFQFGGREISFSLKTGNKELASKRAAAIFRDVVELGGDATIAKHRETASKQKTEAATIGDWRSSVSAWVVPTKEELIIARHTGRLLGLEVRA